MGPDQVVGPWATSGSALGGLVFGTLIALILPGEGALTDWWRDSIAPWFETGRWLQGGSTITQQLAKNLFLSPERTLERKVQEVLLALWLEQKYTKDQILAMYLNRVFFGSNAVHFSE